MALRTRQIIGMVLGSAGVLISIGHLVWMSIRGINEPYHGFNTWVMLGLGPAVVGIFLLRRK